MTKKEKGYIGIFDSGVGGLTIFKDIVKTLPKYSYIYLADSAKAPYGDKPQKLIYSLTKKAVGFLFKKNCELIILACNTASSQALRKIQRDFLPKNYPQKRVLGIIIPTAEEIIAKEKPRKVGVIATNATIKSKAFVKEIKKINSQIIILQKACPSLVPIIEAGKENSKKATEALKKCLNPLLEKNINTLVLGCTHYILLKEKIKKIAGPRVKIVSGEKIVAEKLKEYLRRHPEIESKLDKSGKKVIYTTEENNKFNKLISKLFKRGVKIAKTNL